jgi:uncharacterized cupin superfamily protein
MKMKKILALALAALMALALAACGGSAEQTAEPSDSAATTPAVTTSSAASAEDPADSVSAGTYMYYEDKGDFGVIPWTVVLNEDGTATITEANSHIGDQIHDCAQWTDNGDGTFTTGAWDTTGGPMSEFFAEDGSATWEIAEDGICQPVNGTPSADPALAELNDTSDLDAGGPPENGPVDQLTPTAGTYMYYEDKGDFGVIPWTIVLNEDGTATVTEANEHIGDQIHNCAQWTDNGDGTFTTGAWDTTGGPMSEFFAEDGSATWEIPEEGICQPVNGTASVDPSLAG